MLVNSKIIDNFTANYVAALAGYRVIYLFYFIGLLISEGNKLSWIVWVSTIIQSGLNAEFLYYWFKSKMQGSEIKLPK